MTQEELLATIEKIVREDGDTTLNIKQFMDKMYSEYNNHIRNKLKHECAIMHVSTVNMIPEDLVRELVEIKKR